MGRKADVMNDAVSQRSMYILFVTFDHRKAVCVDSFSPREES